MNSDVLRLLTLVKQYPRLQEIWRDIPWISRSDMGRYLVKQAHGEVYMAMDVTDTDLTPSNH